MTPRGTSLETAHRPLPSAALTAARGGLAKGHQSRPRLTKARRANRASMVALATVRRQGTAALAAGAGMAVSVVRAEQVETVAAARAALPRSTLPSLMAPGAAANAISMAARVEVAMAAPC